MKPLPVQPTFKVKFLWKKHSMTNKLSEFHLLCDTHFFTLLYLLLIIYLSLKGSIDFS